MKKPPKILLLYLIIFLVILMILAVLEISEIIKIDINPFTAVFVISLIIILFGYIFLHKSKIININIDNNIKTYLDASEILFIVTDDNAKINYINESACKLFNLTQTELIGKNLFDIMDNKNWEYIKLNYTNIMNKNKVLPNYIENTIMNNDKKKHIAWHNSLIKNTDNYITGMICLGEDITSRKKTKEALKISETRLRALNRLNKMEVDDYEKMEKFVLEEGMRLTKSIYGFIGFINYDETEIELKPGILNNTKFIDRFDNTQYIKIKDTDSIKKVIETRMPLMVNSEAHKKFHINHPKIKLNRFMIVPVFYMERIEAMAGIANKEEEYTEIDIQQLQLLMDGMLWIIRNKEANNKIKKSLKEKETLLKEIHHRVKNNLQVIYSMLNLQSNYIKDQKVLTMFKESQNRIKTMALIHEKLYRSKNLGDIKFTDYMKNLIENLFNSYNASYNNVHTKTEIEEDLLLNIDIAVPCGLILNELISNALKHAFKDRSSGNIEIVLKKIDGNDYMIRFSDDGVGLPQDIDVKRSKTLGLKLISALTSQLKGTVSVINDHGTIFEIVFPDKKSKNRVD